MVNWLKTHAFQRDGGEDIEEGMRKQLSRDGEREAKEGRVKFNKWDFSPLILT